MANGKYLPKDSPGRTSRDDNISALSLQGMSPAEIAKQDNIPVGKRQVARILSDDRVKQIMDKQFRIYAAHVPGIAKEFLKLCYDPEDKAIRLKAIGDFQKIMGIMPSHTSNVFIQNLNIQQNMTADPEVMALLNKATEPAIDAEFTVFSEEE